MLDAFLRLFPLGKFTVGFEPTDFGYKRRDRNQKHEGGRLKHEQTSRSRQKFGNQADGDPIWECTQRFKSFQPPQCCKVLSSSDPFPSSSALLFKDTFLVWGLLEWGLFLCDLIQHTTSNCDVRSTFEPNFWLSVNCCAYQGWTQEKFRACI